MTGKMPYTLAVPLWEPCRELGTKRLLRKNDIRYNIDQPSSPKLYKQIEAAWLVTIKAELRIQSEAAWPVTFLQLDPQ